MMQRAKASLRYRRLLVEPLESRRLLAFDFGDAPADYPVTLAADGARHAALPGWQSIGDQIRDGWVVSLSGDGSTMAIGEPYTSGDGVASDVGRVRIYQQQAGRWQLLGGEILGQNGFDGFGWAVDLSHDGNTVAIGSPYTDGNGDDSGQTRVLRWNGSAWQPLGGAINGEAGSPSSFTPGDRSGSSVSLSADGNTVAIGAPYNDGAGGDAGHARIYRWSGLQWQQLGGDIDGAPPPSGSSWPGDGVGQIVSLSADGNTVAVNYANRVLLGPSEIEQHGGSRIFHWNGTTWQQLGADIDVAMVPASLDLSADGMTLGLEAVEQGAGWEEGKTFIFAWDGASWQQKGATIPGEGLPETVVPRNRSVSLSEDGSVLAVGVSNNRGNGYGLTAGHVRIFAWDGESWRQQGKDIDGPVMPNEQGRFGRTVSLSADGQSLAIGSTLVTECCLGAPDVNTAQVYRWGETLWRQKGYDLEGAFWDRSGWSVATSADGNTVAVGAPYNDGNGQQAGHARVYRWDGSAWQQLGEDVDGRPVHWGRRVPTRNSRIAVSLSADGNTLIVGAVGQGVAHDDGPGDDYGLTRIFRWDENSWEKMGQDIYGDEIEIDLSTNEKATLSGWSVSVSGDGDTVAIGSPYHDANGKDSGQTRVYRWDGAAWQQLGNDLDGNPTEYPPGSAGKFDFSGASVALSSDGNTLAIGAPGLDEFQFVWPAIGATRIYRWDGSAWQQLGNDILGESNADGAGWSVSLSGDGNTVVVGSPNKDINSFTGHARVYSWDGSQWLKLGSNINAQAQGEKFGWSVALSSDGTTVALGAPQHSDHGVFKGQTRIYRWDGWNWLQLGSPIDGETNVDYSGWSVDLNADGTTVVIGAPFNDDGNSYDMGHSRIYRWNGTQWNQLGEDVDGEATGDGFGKSIAYSADGTTLAIGAPHVLGDGNSQHSRTRMYRWVNDAWLPLGDAITGEANRDRSGWSVSLSADGNTVAIGAPYNDANGSGSGHTRIYRWDGQAWQKLGDDIDGDGDGVASGDLSGWSVSLSGDGNTVAIGAPADDSLLDSISHNGNVIGHTRVYQWSGSAWQQVGHDIAGESDRDRSGWSVSLSADGQTVAIGAPHNDPSGNQDAGHVRVYRRAGAGWQQMGGDLDGQAVRNEFGWSVSLSPDGMTVAIGAPFDDGPADADSQGITRVYRWDGAAWQLLGSEIEGEIPGGYSGWSVALSAHGNTLAVGAPGENDDTFFNQVETDVGHTRVYRWDGLGWQSVGNDIAGRPLWKGSGRAVAITADGGSLAIAASEDMSQPFDALPVYGYARVLQLAPVLGVDKDTESDGLVSAAADADGGDDDGVVFGSLIAGKQAAVDVTVTGTGGFLDAWIDLNDDGDWADSGEQIFSAEPVDVGVNQFTFDVPSTVIDGHVFARFRLSASGGLEPFGSATEGEVEDYRVPVNGVPTLDAIDDLLLGRNAAQQVVDLTGITSGGAGGQPLRITAASSDLTLLPDPMIEYLSPNTTGSLTFTPLADRDGSAVITVEVEDGGLDQDLSTVADNATYQREFLVTINAIPTLDSIPVQPLLGTSAGMQSVVLTGISAGGEEIQLLSVSATSSDESIVGAPVVNYVSGEATATLNYIPSGTTLGDVTLTVTVMDAGFDANFETTDDNEVFERQVEVHVDAKPWTNFRTVNGQRQVWDVDDNGETALLDALLLVNLINRFPEYDAIGLPNVPTDLNQDGRVDGLPGLGLFPDVQGNGRCSLADALAVVNKIHQLASSQSGGGEAETSALVDRVARSVDSRHEISRYRVPHVVMTPALRLEALRSWEVNTGVSTVADRAVRAIISDADAKVLAATAVDSAVRSWARSRQYVYAADAAIDEEADRVDRYFRLLAEEPRWKLGEGVRYSR